MPRELISVRTSDGIDVGSFKHTTACPGYDSSLAGKRECHLFSEGPIEDLEASSNPMKGST